MDRQGDIVPHQPDRIEPASEAVPEAVEASPNDQEAVSPQRPPAFDVSISLGSVNPLPADVLSPEAIERLRAGGTLSRDDLERVRRAAAEDSGIVGKLLEGVLAGVAEIQDADHVNATIAADIAGDPVVTSVPILTKEFVWNPQLNDVERGTVTEPATYYEALTGKPDPMRGFFVTARRLLNVITWIVALGLPLGLVAVGVVIGESLDTIVFMGLAGLVVGMLFKYSLPRTPFG